MRVYERTTKNVPTTAMPPITGLSRTEITRIHNEMKEGTKCNAIGKR
jgi:hypothetical protein